MTQTLAGHEVTLVVEGASRVPARLKVSAESVRPVDLALRLELRSATDGARSTGTVRVGKGSTGLLANEPGPYELRVQAGDEVSVIPFRVIVARDSSWGAADLRRAARRRGAAGRRPAHGPADPRGGG